MTGQLRRQAASESPDPIKTFLRESLAYLLFIGVALLMGQALDGASSLHPGDPFFPIARSVLTAAHVLFLAKWLRVVVRHTTGL